MAAVVIRGLPRVPWWVRTSAVVRAGLVGFVGLVALEHVLRPGLAPGAHFVSEYARGSTQPIQVAAFLSWAAATAACTVLATRAPAGRPLARGLAVVALAAATAGLLLAAGFTSQTVGGKLPAGVRPTTAGRLHDYGTLAVLAGLLVGAYASVRFIRARGYRLTVLALTVVLLAIVPVLVALGVDAPGIGQRAFILVGCAWQWSFARASSSG